MRAAVVAAVLAGAGLLVSHALADSLPVPTLPTVTVPTPTVQVPVPLPTIPTVTPSVVTAPVKTPTSATPALPSVQSATGSVASSTTAAGSQASAAPGSSRTWISTSGPKRRRSTTVTFTLRYAARIAFVVRQVSPTCRVAGRFTVNGHAGRNRIRIPKRLNRRLLQPGTYRIYARTAAGRLVRTITLVVVAGAAPSAAELVAARAANVCGTNTRFASATSAMPTASGGGGLPSASPPVQGESTHPGAVLGTSVARAARAIHPAVIALLALAILLLGVASVPRLAAPHSRASYILASHRLELVGLGAAAFVAVIVAFLLG